MADEGGENRAGGSISQRNSLGPACTPVHQSQDRSKPAAGLQRADKVQVDMRKSPDRNRDLLNRSSLMAVDLGSLAGGALPSPGRHVFIHRRPDKTAGHETAGCSDARMSQAMHLLEGQLAEGGRQKEARLNLGEGVQHAIHSLDLELRITGEGRAVCTSLLGGGEHQWIQRGWRSGRGDGGDRRRRR